MVIALSAGLAGQARTLLGDLRKLEIDRQIQVERVRQAEAAVAESQAAIATVTEDLERLEAQRVAQLVDIYKRGRGGYARLLLGGSSGREFGRATRAVSALMRLNRQRIAEHVETLDAVRQERQRLDVEIPTLQASEAAAQ